MKCFKYAALYILPKVVRWSLCPHSGQFFLVLSGGFFSKVNYLWGMVDLGIKFILPDTSEVNIMELTSPALTLRQVRVIILMTHKLKLRVQLLHHSLVNPPHPLLVGHPLLAEVCALRWSALARLISLTQAKQLGLTTLGFCVKARVAAGGVCNGSAPKYSVFLVAFSLNAGREDVFPTMAILPIFLLYFNNYYNYGVCLSYSLLH